MSVCVHCKHESTVAPHHSACILQAVLYVPVTVHFVLWSMTIQPHVHSQTHLQGCVHCKHGSTVASRHSACILQAVLYVPVSVHFVLWSMTIQPTSHNVYMCKRLPFSWVLCTCQYLHILNGSSLFSS